MTEWLCKDDYKKACETLGVKELPICTIKNYCEAKCTMCGNMADHLVDVKTFRGLFLHRDSIFLAYPLIQIIK